MSTGIAACASWLAKPASRGPGLTLLARNCISLPLVRYSPFPLGQELDVLPCVYSYPSTLLLLLPTAEMR